MKLLPMNPQPPVTKIFIIHSNLSCNLHGRIVDQSCIGVNKILIAMLYALCPMRAVIIHPFSTNHKEYLSHGEEDDIHPACL